MSSEPKHKDDGYSILEAISFFPGELSRDAVGLYQIVPIGRDAFSLAGESLIDFVRRSIIALLDAGAIPVRGGVGTDFDWIPQRQYGADREEVAEAIIKEWLGMPDDPLVLCGEGVWFARPRPAPSRHVKPD